MIVSVFGASSRLGHAFIEQADLAGLTMRLHYRAKPSEKVPSSATVVVGSLADPAAVREVLRGSDVALVLFGHKTDARVPYCAAATKVIVAAMKALSQDRLIVVTDAMTGELPGNVGMGAKLMNMFSKRSAHDGMLEDREEQERLVRGSALGGWTLVKPPKFTDGMGSGAVKIGPSANIGVGSKISRVTLAKALLSEVQAPQFAKQSVYVAES
jgi:putative NADH-flavin reductase